MSGRRGQGGPPPLAADPHVPERLRAEVEAARRAGAFHTAPVVDADPEAQAPWLATAHIPGPTLAELIKRQHSMSKEQLRRPRRSKPSTPAGSYTGTCSQPTSSWPDDGPRIRGGLRHPRIPRARAGARQRSRSCRRCVRTRGRTRPGGRRQRVRHRNAQGRTRTTYSLSPPPTGRASHPRPPVAPPADPGRVDEPLRRAPAEPSRTPRVIILLIEAGRDERGCLADERLVDPAKTLARHRPRLARRGGGQPGNPTGEDPYGIAGDIGLDRQPNDSSPGSAGPAVPLQADVPGPGDGERVAPAAGAGEQVEDDPPLDFSPS